MSSSLKLESLEIRLALSTDPLVILPLGDSITQGEFHSNAVRQSYGYRAALQQMLVEHEIAFDFVGSQNERCREPDDTALPFEGFDPDHEGHWGWTAEEMLGGRWESTCGEVDRTTLPQWIGTQESVDVVLMHVGTNEIIQALPSNHTAPRNDLTPAQIDEIAESIGGLVDSVLQEVDDPDLQVLVSEIIPGTLFIPEAAALNERLAAELQAKPNVAMVDQFSGFDPSSMTYDAVHPNALGQQHMAERWFEAIRATAICEAKPVLGDFDASGVVDEADVASLQAAMRDGGPSAIFDINGDGLVDDGDLTFLVEVVLGTVNGDTNLDGAVNFDDFLIMSNNFSQQGDWSTGDFDGDGLVDFFDFLAVSRNFGRALV